MVIEGVGHVGQRYVRPRTGHPVSQRAGRGHQALGTLAADNHGGDRRLDGRLSGFGRRRLLQDQVGVGATETERRHPCQARASGIGPDQGFVDDPQTKLVERDVRIGIVEVLIGRDLTALDRHRRLDQADDAGGCLQVSEVCFGRPDQQWGLRGASPPEDGAESAGFDGVAEQRAGSVGFHVVDFGRLHTGIRARGAQHGGLGGRTGCHQTVGPAVGVHR